MATIRRHARFAPALVMCSVIMSADAARSQPRQKEVLVLYSTRPDAQIAVVGDREIPAILERGLRGGIDYYADYIEPSRFPDPSYERAFRDYLLLKYTGHPFDVVIAVGERALAFVDRNRGRMFPDVPVVFFSSDPAARRLPNSTGVKSPLNLRDSIVLALELQPQTRHLFVVTGAGGSDAVYLKAAQDQLRSFEPRLSVTYLSGLTTPQLHRQLAALPKRSIVYYLLVSRDGGGEDVHPLTYLARVAAIANAPTYTWVDSAIGYGVVGGSLKSQASEISAVATLALRVLRGERADSIADIEVDLNVRQVDWRELRRWAVSEARVPPGTRILFRQPGFWHRYKVHVLGALIVILAQAALIAGLVFQRLRRRAAERRMRDLSGWLIDAQEVERLSLARELHDDIGAQMAVLAIDLHRLTDTERSGSNGTTPLAREVVDRTQQIAETIQHLSHRLHPAKAQLIGLRTALESLQRDFSRSDFSITLAHGDVPESLPQELSLCLFRIVEEALRNAVKHSNARNVSVQLFRSADALTLTIVDDGVGFDPDEAWGRGLGLISMTTRLEQCGGRLDIYSEPGAGTRLQATVPLRCGDDEGRRASWEGRSTDGQDGGGAVDRTAQAGRAPRVRV